MVLTDIRLQNFRSYKDESFELAPGVNIIVGPNASGKTNLLEAVLVLAAGRSYRTKDSELIKNQASWARLEAHTPKGSRTVKIEQGERANKTYVIDEKLLRRLPMSASLPVVLFEPNNLWLLSGEPVLRREFLDNILGQIEPGFKEASSRYQRVLKQRNTLLKKWTPAARSQLFAWNVRLSELGGQIASARSRLVKQIALQLPYTYNKLSKDKVKTSLGYKSVLNLGDYSSSMLKRLEADTELDILRGFTGQGPHRDDLEILIEGRPLGLVASRGESRTMLLSLKMIELKLLEQFRQEPPLLLLDDVFSELDGKRRRAVTEFFKNYQTFITTTDADAVVDNFTGKHHVIALNRKSNGRSRP